MAIWRFCLSTFLDYGKQTKNLRLQPIIWTWISWPTIFNICNIILVSVYNDPITLILTYVCPCIVSIIVNDDQQDATILAYLFIPNQLYMFRVMSSPIVRSTWLYLQLLILSTDTAAGWYHGVPSYPWYQPAAVSVDNITSCKYHQVLLMMGEDITWNM